MAEIELGPLTDRLNDDEIADLHKRIQKLGVTELPHPDDPSSTAVDSLDDDVLTEFLDRLEASDAAAEIYLPIEFEDVLEIAGLRVASAPLLLDVLEEMKDELEVEADEDEEEEDEDDYDDPHAIVAGQLKQAWKLFYSGATAALERKLPMHIKA